MAAEVRRQARALAERPSAARGDEEDLFSTIVKVAKQLHERLVEDCRLAGPALHSFGAAVAADACRRALPGPLWVRMRRLAKMADIARHATMAGARRLLLEAEGWLDEHPPEGRGENRPHVVDRELFAGSYTFWLGEETPPSVTPVPASDSQACPGPVQAEVGGCAGPGGHGPGGPAVAAPEAEVRAWCRHGAGCPWRAIGRCIFRHSDEIADAGASLPELVQMDVLPAGGDHDAYLRDALARSGRSSRVPSSCTTRACELDEASAIPAWTGMHSTAG